MEKVILTSDVRSCNGELLAGFGATGRVVCYLDGFRSVIFDRDISANVLRTNGEKTVIDVPAIHTCNLAFIGSEQGEDAPMAGDKRFIGHDAAFEFGPRCQDEDGVYLPEDGEEPLFWSVYTRALNGGPASWVADYTTREEARSVALALSKFPFST